MPSIRSALMVSAVVVVVVLVGGFASMPAMDDAAAADLEDEQTGSEITVAVIDTGIDDGHTALEGRVVDRVDLTDAGGDSPSELDSHGHGTHVAGIVAGSGDGESASVDLVDVRVLGDEGEGDADRIAEGIEYAVEEAGVDIIVLSLNVEGIDREPIDDSVARATADGTLVVASAGNSATTRSITDPGTTNELVTVGATAENGSVLSESSRGPTGDGLLKPELVAPGERISGPVAGTSDEYTTRTGTSVAAPQVVAVAASILEGEPDLSPQELEDRLTSTARPVAGTDVYAAGSGELDPDRATEPDIVAHDGIVDFGLVGTEDPKSQTVTFENQDDRSHDLSLEPTLANLDAEADATGLLSVNRTEMTLEPGEREAVSVGVDANTTSGIYGGTLEYDVGGEPRSVPLGFVRGGTVTVEKEPFSAGDRVDGDPLFFFTEDGSHSGIQDFEDGETSFVAAGGTYVLWSKGVDEETGSIVFLSDRLEVGEDTHVVLDEAETIPVGVDADPIAEEYGPLSNDTVAVSMSTEVGDEINRLSRTVLDADNRTVRVSEDTQNAIATTYLLTPDDASSLTAEDVFQVHYEDSSAHWTSPRSVSPEDLETTEYRIHRTTQDRSYEARDLTRTSFEWNDPARYWFDLGDRGDQRVHRTAGGAVHERELRGENWHATVDDRDVSSVDVLAHPMIGAIDSVSVDDVVAVEAEPLADGAGTEFAVAPDHTLSVAVGGELYEEIETNEPTITADDVPLEGNETLTITLEGNNSDGRLSTKTFTEVDLEDPHEASRTPLISDIDVDVDETNAAGPGEVTATFDVADARSVSQPSVWYTDDAHETPPWGDDAGWERAQTGYEDGRLTASMDVPEDTETVSLAAELENDGDRVRTMTTDAFYAGEAPNTSTRTISGELVTANNTPADNDSVLASPIDGDSLVETRTDDDGVFDLEVPKNETYELTYRQGEPWVLNGSIEDDRPAFAALGEWTVEDNLELEEQLPTATPVSPHVVDERGESVGNATVELTHREGNVSASVTGESTADGTLQWLEDEPPGVAVPVSANLTVNAPDEAPYVDATHSQTVTESKPEPTVELANEPPEAELSTNRNWMLEGTPVTLDASDSDVPAAPAEYRWDLSGDGSIDEVTPNPVVRHEPPVGTTELSVTVVDEAGDTDTASQTVQVDPVGE